MKPAVPVLAAALLVASAALCNAQTVLLAPSRDVAAAFFSQTSPSAVQAPAMPIPATLTPDQYAYLVAQQSYLVGLLGRIEQELDGLRTLKQSSDTVYMERIGQLEQKLSAVIENNSTSTTAKATTILSAIGAFGASFYTAARCPQP